MNALNAIPASTPLGWRLALFHRHSSAYTLLLHAHFLNITTIISTERIKQKLLYVRAIFPTQEDNRHRHRCKDYFPRHQKPRPLSARERRAHIEVFGVPTSQENARNKFKVQNKN
ncbi:hypothetical protein ASPACDRAFT_45096 [Aspergillus aculeatus ATCC 16872]|uniref:Uncharacterized protein n=1 Tax=Aspergillus aculeatus (strain ATCC 16872 / CBS 172.66 / WB 5094) TaxID=690307 RepID=A0A1L9WNS8_ASPA1|nr:uncharacterized protein ASPACDRAFT_45096 [Aspergillus aculeatus ATCC 16872]OJJ97797.1 hypothetical protein ASPACDRAFT_45096 [Aspergillus aculeatus ATCC 16872]